jgi:hypothetical protein
MLYLRAPFCTRITCKIEQVALANGAQWWRIPLRHCLITQYRNDVFGDLLRKHIARLCRSLPAPMSLPALSQFILPAILSLT